MPISYHRHEEGGEVVYLPYLNPKHMLERLLLTEPWLLLGGLDPGEDCEALLKTFWETYKVEQPTHAVYEMARAGILDLAFTIPLVLHGDGARTLKKQPLEVLSFQPFLGVTTPDAVLKCKCPHPVRYRCNGPRGIDAMSLRLNFQGDSYMHHFLMVAFPTKKFAKTPGLLHSVFEHASEDLSDACNNGLMVAGQKWHVAVVGMRGDMEYHHKMGSLRRSYMNVGTTNLIQCCHMCEAGSVHVPFEDYSLSAAWQHTLFRSLPWESPPPFRSIPYEDWTSGRASAWFKGDPFHIFRLGIARNFIASSLIMMCLGGLFDQPGEGAGIVDRLSRAWSQFALWCASEKVTTSGIRTFSKDKLHFNTMNSFPWVGCKGSDTILLLRWLRFYAGLKLIEFPDLQYLPVITEACDHGLALQAIHRHGLFLKPGCRDNVSRSCRMFLFCYATLANMALQNDQTLFAQLPKGHALAHIFMFLEMSKRQGHAVCLNPGAWDCSQSEDFVGKVARQSRRVSYRNVVYNTLLSYLVKTRAVIKRHVKQKRQQR